MWFHAACCGEHFARRETKHSTLPRLPLLLLLHAVTLRPNVLVPADAHRKIPRMHRGLPRARLVARKIAGYDGIRCMDGIESVEVIDCISLC